MNFKLKPLFVVFIVTVFSCKNVSTDTSEVSGPDTLVNNQITLNDFNKIAGVENINDVPFELFTKLDSVNFYIQPSLTSKTIKIENNKFYNYYGFTEVGDFYSIHFSINNALNNTIEAFVLKSEFNKASNLSLIGVNLNEIRYSIFKNNNDDVTKSFSKFGNVQEVSLAEFNEAKSKSLNEKTTKNKDIVLQNNIWISQTYNNELLVNDEVTEAGKIQYTYIGYSKLLNSEIFLEETEYSSDSYYVFIDSKSGSRKLFTPGYPQIINNGTKIASLSNSNDVGCYLNILLNKESEVGKELLFINFTNFKISNSEQVYWLNDKTIFAEVVPTNSTAVNGEQNKSYIKISFEKEL